MADRQSSVKGPDQGGFSPIKFLSEVKVEMDKVSWPERRELVRYTGVVSVTVFVVCVLIWICDSFFSRLFDLILR